MEMCEEWVWDNDRAGGVFKFSNDTPDMGVAIIWLVVV